MADQLKPTSAAEFRRRQTFTARIDNDLVVELRRSDMLTMVMNDAMPLPMLEAAMNFENEMAENERKRQEQGLPKQTMLEQYAGIDKKLTAALIDTMRHYAVIHCVNPKFSLENEPADPNVLPVNMLSGQQLLGIFYASPEGEEKEAEVINKNEAIEFRGPQPVDVRDAGPSGEAVRPAAKLLDLPQREAITA